MAVQLTGQRFKFKLSKHCTEGLTPNCCIQDTCLEKRLQLNLSTTATLGTEEIKVAIAERWPMVKVRLQLSYKKIGSEIIFEH